MMTRSIADLGLSASPPSPPSPPRPPTQDASPGKDRVFEMRTYYTPKAASPALNKRFREHTCELFKKHGMELIGFWTPVEEKDGKSNKLVYILAYPSMEAREASWKAFQADPEWKKARDASEEDGKIVEKVESVFLNPTDYSADQVEPSRSRPMETDPCRPTPRRSASTRSATPPTRSAPWIHRTPVMTSRTLDERSGGSVFLKAENFQKVGAFKIRGAMNALLRLDEADRARGVVTHSSGNHAQALAQAGKWLGVPVYVVMPRTAPAIKRAATEGYGATGRPLRADPRRPRVGRRRADRPARLHPGPPVRRLGRDRRPGDGRLGTARPGRAARRGRSARSAAAGCSPGRRWR